MHVRRYNRDSRLFKKNRNDVKKKKEDGTSFSKNGQIEYAIVKRDFLLFITKSKFWSVGKLAVLFET